MKASALKTTALFYITSAGFVVMALMGWPLFNNAMKGKEKDFYDRLFIPPLPTSNNVPLILR